MHCQPLACTGLCFCYLLPVRRPSTSGSNGLDQAIGFGPTYGANSRSRMFFPCLCVSSKSEGKDAHSLHVLACFCFLVSVFRNMSPPQSVAPLTPTEGLSDSREQGTLLVPTSFPLSGINKYGRTRSIWSWKMQSRPGQASSWNIRRKGSKASLITEHLRACVPLPCSLEHCIPMRNLIKHPLRIRSTS